MLLKLLNLPFASFIDASLETLRLGVRQRSFLSAKDVTLKIVPENLLT